MKYAISALIGAAIVFFLMRSCTPSIPPVVKNKGYDSLLAKNKRDSIAYTTRIAVLESIAADNETSANDSRRIADSIYLTLSDQIEQVEFTNHKLTLAKVGHDTAGYYKACDTLSEQSKLAIRMGSVYKVQRDTLIKKLDQANVAIYDAKETAKNEVARLNGISDRKSSIIDSCTQIAFKWQKVASKRWSIGIGAGYGVGKSGLTPIAGIQIQYSLIKF